MFLPAISHYIIICDVVWRQAPALCVPRHRLCCLLQVVFGGELQEKGCNFELKVNSAEDLNRSVRFACFFSHEETNVTAESTLLPL